jgi:hypothetical protein
LLIISGEEEKVGMPLNFAKTQIKAGNKIKVVFWGPSQETLSGNNELRKEYVSALNEKPKGRINYARKHNLETTLSDDIELVPVGDYLAKAVAEGYEIITF